MMTDVQHELALAREVVNAAKAINADVVSATGARLESAFMAYDAYMGLAPDEDITRPEDIAAAILASEDFMWLMCGGDDQWVDSHLRALRPAWDAYVAAGGRTWGH